MYSLQDLNNDDLTMKLYLMSTTQSMYRVLMQSEIVQGLRSQVFSLEELEAFANECLASIQPGFASWKDYQLQGLAAVMENTYWSGDPSDPVTRFAEDFYHQFATKQPREFHGTVRICKYIMEKGRPVAEE